MLALASPASTVLASRTSSALTEGARIRVDLAEPWASEQGPIGKPLAGGGRRWTGTCVAMNEALLTLRVPEVGRPREVPRSVITGLDSSVGAPHQARGAVLGFVIGFAAGAAVVLASSEDSSSDWVPAEAVALLVGVPAGLVGLTVGAVLSRERWEPVDLSRPPPDRSGPGAPEE